MKNNILVTGANGQLGSELHYLTEQELDSNFIYTDVEDLDICDVNQIDDFLANNNINVIINCAAYTNVDKAENEPQLAKNINTTAVENLVKASEKFRIKLIHISTDYVFGGKSFSPLKEADNTDPIGVYGNTKLEGENVIVNSNITYAIIRTSWLYSSFGNNFVKTITKFAKQRDELTVIADQVGTPTYARDLATAILHIFPQLTQENKGIYHFSNEGVASWYDFAKEIVSTNNITCKVTPVETKDYQTKAERPCYSVLNKNKIKSTFGVNIPYWRDALSTCVINHS